MKKKLFKIGIIAGIVVLALAMVLGSILPASAVSNPEVGGFTGQAFTPGQKKWVNTWTEVEDLGGGKFGATISVGHRVFFDKADGNKPKKHKLTDNRPDYVLIQSAQCCVEVHPYYAKYFDVQHEEVRLYEERWVVQRWRDPPGKWFDVGAWNPQTVVEEYSEPAGDVVKVTVTYDTSYGTLTVEYFQRDGNNLKHNVTFKNTSGSTETFRVLQRWAGIVGNKCNGHNVPVVEHTPYLRFHKANKPQEEFTISENLWSMVFNPDGSEKTDQRLQSPITIDTHAQGMKADFIYGNWVLANSKSLEIDPDTATLNNPTEDSYLERYGGPEASFAAAAAACPSATILEKGGAFTEVRFGGWGQDFDPDYYSYTTRGFVEWNISALAGVTIDANPVFKYHGQTALATDGEINPLTEGAPSGASDADNWTRCASGIAYVDPFTLQVGTGKSQDLGASAKTDLQTAVTAEQSWFALGFQSPDDECPDSDTNIFSRFYSENKTDAANPKPTLYVEYTSAVSAPTVSTQAADDLEDTTATLNGTVTDDGGATIDYFGFVWDTGADQGDPGDVDPSGPAGTWDYGWKSGAGDYGENPFDHGITELPEGTTIYFRAAAHNSEGWSYGGGASFLTKPAAPTGVAATDNVHSDKVVVTWNKSTGATNYKIYEGINLLDTIGDFNTFDDTNAPVGTIDDAGTVSATDGDYSAHIELSLDGESTTVGASRTYKVVALNATGDSDDSTTDTGYRKAGTITYAWWRSNADDDAAYASIVGEGGTTDPYEDDNAPVSGAGRWYYCIVSSVDASNSPQESTHDRGFRAAPPDVTTNACDDLEDTTATGNAEIVAIGGEDCTIRGFVWDLDTHGDPGNVSPAVSDYANDVDEIGNFGTGIFDGALTELPTGDQIYVRAYAYNPSWGYDYGYEVDFLTKPAKPANVQATDGDHSGKIVITWDASTGATDYNLKIDGGWTGWLGNVLTHDDNAPTLGTVTGGDGDASDGTVEAHSVLTVAGHGVVDGANSTYIVKAKNATGESDESDSDTGYVTPGVFSYAWQISDADLDDDFNPIPGANTNPYEATEFPADGSGRYAYCEVSAVDASNNAQDSTHDRGYRLVPATVDTVACSGFAKDWAIVNGVITDDGDNVITQVRFEYGLTSGYGDTVTKDVDDLVTGDVFWMKLPDLTAGTVYHFRAEAFNGGWNNGSDMVFSTEGSATMYERLNTLGDVDGDDIYAGHWGYMQFTVGAVTHSADYANIYVKRTGSPGDAILSIRHANVANEPTGADLDIMTLDGNDFSDALNWVRYDFPLDITLEAGESYALVLRCPSGSIDVDFLEWRWDDTGSLANARAGKSTNSGITWAVDDDGADYLFEIWGEPVFEVIGAQVFSGYRETGDWLIVLTYRNYYTPYYPTETAADYFYLQLLDNVVVKAQVGCPAWGYRPGSIYIAKSLADTLEWGATDYKISLYGDFGANPHTDYPIAAADWRGTELSFLDAWVITQAKVIGENMGINLVVLLADRGEVLNATGHTIFSIGIPYLSEVRPNLFELVTVEPEYEEKEYTHALEEEATYRTRCGNQVADMLDDAGDLIGVGGDTFGGFMIAAGFIGIAATLTAVGHLVMGLSVGYLILLAGAWFGLVSWIIVGVITFLMAVIFVYKTWLTR